MLTKKVDKSPDPRAHRPVAVVHRAKRHFNRQPFVSQQFDKRPFSNFFIHHIVRQTGYTVTGQTQLLERFPAIGRYLAFDFQQLAIAAGNWPGIQGYGLAKAEALMML